ncbi:MAG: PAS domain S-box protein, partial [Pseudohongiellaceae bacterium]
MPVKQILKIAGGYALISLLYISFSDWLLFTLFPNAANLQYVSMVKGWGFVILTASTLAALLRRIQLRESRRYRALLDNHLAVMLVIDPVSGRILDASKAAEKYYGWSMNKLRGKPLSEIDTQGTQKIQADMADALSRDQSVFHYRHRRAHGEIRDVDVYSGPIELEGKTVLLSLVQDVTRLHRSTNEILRLNKLFAQLSNTNKLIMHASDRKVLFDGICRIAVNEGGFLFCWLGLVDEQGIVKPVARAGKDQGYIDQLFITVDTGQKTGGGPTALSLASGKHVVSNDFLKDPRT